MTLDQRFESELKVFRTECDSATQFLFGYFTVRAVAFDHSAVHNVLNTAPLFWNTILDALQTAAHIALGRIFDQNSTYNVDRVLGLAQQNLKIFSQEALGRRKQAASPN